LSAAPHFVLLSDVPLQPAGSGSTTFGNFKQLQVWIGQGKEARMWTARAKDATFGDKTYAFDAGRVFLATRGEPLRQLQVPLDLGTAAAPALADAIERLDDVRDHLGLATTAVRP
jgi:hypothetical protein